MSETSRSELGDSDSVEDEKFLDEMWDKVGEVDYVFEDEQLKILVERFGEFLDTSTSEEQWQKRLDDFLEIYMDMECRTKNMKDFLIGLLRKKFRESKK